MCGTLTVENLGATQEVSVAIEKKYYKGNDAYSKRDMLKNELDAHVN